jgi:hypothetical protein
MCMAPYCNILNVSPPRPEIVGPDKSLSPTRKPFNNILQYGLSGVWLQYASPGETGRVYS